MLINTENIVSTFSAKGIVLGNMWGGDKGIYTSTKLQAPTLEELNVKINAALEDGTLDGGGGFDGLIGAEMGITETQTIEIDGTPFTNENTYWQQYGELSEEESDMFANAIF